MSSSSKTCAVPGCSREGRIVRGLCIGHYNRQLRDGTPDAADLERRTGAAHHNWRAVPTYWGMHQRIRKLRGNATEHVCAKCGKPAQQWAYRHDDPMEITDPRGFPYSIDPARYDALCISCHVTTDQPPVERGCSVPDCARKHRARGFCDKHYKQHRKGALQ